MVDLAIYISIFSWIFVVQVGKNIKDTSVVDNSSR